MALSKKAFAVDLNERPEYQRLLEGIPQTHGMRSGRVYLEPGKACGQHSTKHHEELLVFLARHPGSALSRDLLLERVWGWDYGGGSRTVDVHVRWLREKVEADPANPERIVTVRGVGYCFEG